MPRKIDYFNYWSKNRKDESWISDREKISLKLISNLIKPSISFLDVGCGYGKFMILLKNKFPSMSLYGVDYSKLEVAKAKKKSLNVCRADLEKGLKFKSSSFDMIFAGEIIEHLYNPDFFLEESGRVLKKGGFLLITTPNLCSWFNRIVFPLGVQPLFLEPSTKSKIVGAGFLGRFKKESQPVGHVRIFTFKALKDMLEMNGFKLVAVRGSIFDQGFPKSILVLDRVFKIYPKLSSIFVILAKKL